MATVKLTPTQQKFFDLMADGQRHYVDEFIALLPDPLGNLDNVQVHIDNLRKIIRTIGEDVVAERVYWNKTFRRVRMIGPGE